MTNKMVSRVGTGSVNLVFFDYGGNLSLSIWDRTSESAYRKLRSSLRVIFDQSAKEYWPTKIFVVFVVFEGEEIVEIPFITQLGVDHVHTDRDMGYLYLDLDKEENKEESDRIRKYVEDNWKDYTKMKGVVHG